jgi:hypothetical protein
MVRQCLLCFLVAASVACGPNVRFLDEATGTEPVRSDYGDKPSWTLTEGITVVLKMTPQDANVSFTSDDPAIVRVQETSTRGTFMVMPFNPGKTIVRARGDAMRTFNVEVKPQP